MRRSGTGKRAFFFQARGSRQHNIGISTRVAEKAMYLSGEE